MKIITNVEVIDVEGENMAKVLATKNILNVSVNGASDIMPASVIQDEIVRAKHFIKPNGEHIYIAATKEVQELLQFPLDNIYKILDENKQLKEINYRHEKEIEKIMTYGFWKRFKCLFTGIN